MEGFIVRPVRESEIEELGALSQAVYADTFGSSMSADDLKEDLAHRGSDYFRSRLAEDVILVAASSSAIIGFAQFGSNKDWGSQLKKLYISSAWHRRGVGKALMQHVMQALSGADTIMLTVYEENKSALALYTRFGFGVVGKVDVVVAGRVVGEDLVMIRLLNKRMACVAACPAMIHEPAEIIWLLRLI